MTTASIQAQAQKITPTYTTGRKGDDLKILQELEQIGNNPDSETAREDAWPKIDALRDSYGTEVVDPIIADIYATNVYGVDSIMSKYASNKMPGAAQAAVTEGRGKSENIIADVLLHRRDILGDNDSVVKDTSDKDQTKDLSGESFINITSQTHQCILQHYIDDVADYHRSEMSQHESLTFSTQGPAILRGSFAPTGDEEYHQTTVGPRIILIDDSDPNSSVAPINALTSLGKTSGLSKLLPADLAKAMPKLRLYKIYRKNGKETGKVEFKFPTATDSGFLTDVATEDADGNVVPATGNDFVLSPGYAKGRAAGIKSFDWSFIGGDPFTATRDLTAKLTIFFQDFRDLTLVRQGANLLDEKKRQAPYKYLDLIVQPDCRGEAFTANSTTSPVPNTTNKPQVFNPDCYEVAVEVGYAEYPDLPDALKNRNDTLYLTMVEHSFDIGQDGTFSLSIDYRARLASLLGDKGMNVLSPGGGHMIKDDPSSTGLVFDIREVVRQIEEEESKKNPNKLELDALKATEKHLLYVRNNGLYRGITETLLFNGLVYDLDMPDGTFTKFSQFNKYSREGGKNKLVGIDDIPDLRPGAISRAGSFEASSAELERTTQSLEEEDKAPSTVRRDVKNTKTGRTQLGKIVTIDNMVYRNRLRDSLHFTTVGNLIAVALEHIIGNAAFSIDTLGDIEVIKNIHKANLKDYDESMETEKTKKEKAEKAAAPVTAGTTVDTGSTKGYNYGEGAAPYDTDPNKVTINETQRNLLERFRIILGSISYKDARTGNMKAINIAHMPVSMQMFRQFMIDRVIGNQRAFYSFQDFVRDILTDIVFDSLQRICFGGVTQDTKLRTGISLFNGQGAGKKGADEPITSLDKDELYGYRRPKAEAKAYYKSLTPTAAKSSNPIFKNIASQSALDFNYLMFTAFSVAAMNKNLHGDEAEDNDSGIAHFRYGSKAGMMKSISFTKTPLEYAAEERYVREGSDNLLNQLAGRYEMQMSLVGNNMFIPGQYVYFDPVALGVGKSMTNDGSSRSLANLMGLGGYHIITEVGSSISPGKFETTIKALWETGGSMPPAAEKK